MRITHLYLERFKRFERQEIDFKNPLTNDAVKRKLILGDNGTGKTTVLQAITLCLSLASGNIKNSSQFDWLGWVSGRYQQNGEPIVELKIEFEDEEIATTIEVTEKWLESKKFKRGVIPSDNKTLTLRLKGESVEAFDEQGNTKPSYLYQLHGRRYAKELLESAPYVRRYFNRLPGYYWFDQSRQISRMMLSDQTTETNQNLKDIPYTLGIRSLRKHLNNWRLNYIQNPEIFNWYAKLEEMYTAVFPDRKFAGGEPIYSSGSLAPEESYFLLSDGKNTYDIEEMSAGEQSVLPILVRFIQQALDYSIILIDEVDLNLHPPLAQQFYKVLPVFGPHCQFILTTHSDAISTISNQHEIHRLKGGHLCL